MKKAFLSLCFFCAFNAQAIQVDTGSTIIVTVNSLTNYGTGDVIFSTENSKNTECPVFWITKTDPGFQANLSMIIAAYHAKTPVSVVGITDLPWGGTTGKSCKLYYIQYNNQ